MQHIDVFAVENVNVTYIDTKRPRKNLPDGLGFTAFVKPNPCPVANVAFRTNIHAQNAAIR